MKTICSRDRAVGIVTAYGLANQGIRVRVPVRSRFSFLYMAQTVSEAYPLPWALSSGLKRQGREADRSSPTTADVKKNVDLYNHSRKVFMAKCLIS
jgi:hypothetical protein